MIRTHVMLPEELVKELDQVVEKRKRSAFVEEAVRAKLLNERQKRLLRETAGAFQGAIPAEWETPEKTSAWVRRHRDQDEVLRPRRDW